MNGSKKDVSQAGGEKERDPVPSGNIQVVRFEDLANGENEIVVEYERHFYRLRVTRNGKLILNK